MKKERGEKINIGVFLSKKDLSKGKKYIPFAIEGDRIFYKYIDSTGKERVSGILIRLVENNWFREDDGKFLSEILEELRKDA